MSTTYEQRAFSLPPDTTEVVLIRHGASAPYVPGQSFPLTDGHGDPGLASAGEVQARAVAARLAGEDLSHLFVTTLQRTHQTAAPLAAATGMEPVVIADLREVHLGEWEGGEYRRRLTEGGPVVHELFATERWDTIPGAEPAEALADRVRRGIEQIVATTGPGRRSAAVVHGGVIGEIARQATASRPFAFIHNENGSISRLLVFPDGRWLLRSFNDTSHL